MTKTQAVGWWITGVLVTAGLSAIIGTLFWSELRTSQQTMEGGWTRTVIDQSAPWLPIPLALFIAMVPIWTAAFVAYHLIHGDIRES